MNGRAKNVTDERSWWLQNRWLLLRRLSQRGILALFMLGPLAGLWIIKGNLNASLTLGVLPLTDPFVLLQAWLADHRLGLQAAQGVLIVTVFYVLVGAKMPSLLLEIGFITNPREAKRMKQAKYQKYLAESIALGVEKYFKKLNSKKINL